MEEILVLGVSRYQFSEEGTNRLVQGCRVSYLTDWYEDEADRRGFQVMEVTGEYGVFNQAKAVPGIYRAQFAQRMDRRTRKVVVSLVGLSDGRPVDVGSAFTGASSLAAD